MHENQKADKINVYKSMDIFDMDSSNLFNKEQLEIELNQGLESLYTDSNLASKLGGIRERIAEELGVIIPQIKLTVNRNKEGEIYSLTMKGVELFSNEVKKDKMLLIPEKDSKRTEHGIQTKEPIYGMEAYWVDPERAENAAEYGYIIDIPSLITTHILEELKRNISEIITRQEVFDLVSEVRKTHPVVVDGVLKVADYGLLLKLMKRLLKENIPLTDMVTLLEATAQTAEHTKSIKDIEENVRFALYRTITNRFKSKENNTVNIITLDGDTEENLMGKQENNVHLVMNIEEIKNFIETTGKVVDELQNEGVLDTVLVVDPKLRKAIFDIYDRFDIYVPVLSHSELDPKIPFNVVRSIKLV